MTTPDADTMLTSGQLGQLWHVDSKTVTRYAQKEGLPFEETPGGHRRYRWETAEAWREDQAERRRQNRLLAADRLNRRWAEIRAGNGQAQP